MRICSITFSFIVIGFCLLLPQSTTLAACEPVPAKVLWQSPEQGAVDVSVLAPVFVVASPSSSVRVLVEGEELAEVEPGLWRFGINTPLTPDTVYSLTVIATADDGTEDIKTTSFRTEVEATEPQGAPIEPEPATWDVYSSWGHLNTACQAVLAAVNCSGSGEDLLLTLNADFDGADAWIVEPIGANNELGSRHLWPSICGGPSVRAAPQVLAAPDTCYSLKAVGGQGILAQFTKRCGPFVSLDATAEGDDVSGAEHVAGGNKSGGCRAQPEGNDATLFWIAGVFWLGHVARRKSGYANI